MTPVINEVRTLKADDPETGKPCSGPCGQPMEIGQTVMGFNGGTMHQSCAYMLNSGRNNTEVKTPENDPSVGDIYGGTGGLFGIADQKGDDFCLVPVAAKPGGRGHEPCGESFWIHRLPLMDKALFHFVERRKDENFTGGSK